MPPLFRQTYERNHEAAKAAMDQIKEAMERDEPDDTDNLPEAPDWGASVATLFERKRDDGD